MRYTDYKRLLCRSQQAGPLLHTLLAEFKVLPSPALAGGNGNPSHGKDQAGWWMILELLAVRNGGRRSKNIRSISEYRSHSSYKLRKWDAPFPLPTVVR